VRYQPSDPGHVALRPSRRQIFASNHTRKYSRRLTLWTFLLIVTSLSCWLRSNASKGSKSWATSKSWWPEDGCGRRCLVFLQEATDVSVNAIIAAISSTTSSDIDIYSRALKDAQEQTFLRVVQGKFFLYNNSKPDHLRESRIRVVFSHDAEKWDGEVLASNFPETIFYVERFFFSNSARRCWTGRGTSNHPYGSLWRGPGRESYVAPVSLGCSMAPFFLHQFLGHYISQKMEDPGERDAKAEALVHGLARAAAER
jgi:hypothetical protein